MTTFTVSLFQKSSSASLAPIVTVNDMTNCGSSELSPAAVIALAKSAARDQFRIDVEPTAADNDLEVISVFEGALDNQA